LPTPELKSICSQSIGVYHLNTDSFKKRLKQLEWLDQQFPNFFEHDPDLSLVNKSRLKYQQSVVFSRTYTQGRNEGGAKGAQSLCHRITAGRGE